MVKILLILLSLPLHSAEKSEAFVARIFDRKVKVIAPLRYQDNMSLVLINKTLSTVIGKVVINEKRVHSFVTLRPESSTSLNLDILEGDKVVFYPQAPAFQEINFVVGKRSYEIPPPQ